MFANAGQDCCARARVIVERKIYPALVEAMASVAKRDARSVTRWTKRPRWARSSPPTSGSGPRATWRWAGRKGPGYVCGGERPEGDGYFLRPAIFADAKPGMRIVDEEIFGPMVVVIPFDTEAEAIAIANDSIYGLSGSLWTNDLKRGLRVARAIQTGVLSVNSSSSVHLQGPFGGFKQSGLGRELGMHALGHYTELKNIYFETT